MGNRQFHKGWEGSFAETAAQTICHFRAARSIVLTIFWGARADRRHVSEAENFFRCNICGGYLDARITYGFWIAKAHCRNRRKIKLGSATGSSACARGACELGKWNVLASSRRRMRTLR